MKQLLSSAIVAAGVVVGGAASHAADLATTPPATAETLFYGSRYILPNSSGVDSSQLTVRADGCWFASTTATNNTASGRPVRFTVRYTFPVYRGRYGVITTSGVVDPGRRVTFQDQSCTADLQRAYPVRPSRRVYYQTE